jgi:hypothetical protein
VLPIKIVRKAGQPCVGVLPLSRSAAVR